MRELLERPSEHAFEGSVAALHGEIGAKEHDSDGRRIENSVKLSGRAPEFGGTLGDNHLQLVARMSQCIRGVTSVFGETRVLKSHRGLICGDGDEQLIGLSREIGATRRDRDKTTFALHAEGKHQPRISVVGMTDIGDRRFFPNLVLAQPFAEIRPRVASMRVDGHSRGRIAQTDEGKLEAKGADERIGQACRNGRRGSSDPRGRNDRNRNQISERRAKAQILAGVHKGQMADAVGE